jgi:alkaline phosphatase
MIGDGMGLTQITAGLYSNGNKLNLERFPVIGLHKSYSSDNLVTDSAAGATAFSAGRKTYNGAIGVDNDSMALYTILEEAEANGLPTGMVSTSTIVHATPASFIAHQAQRSYYEAIAADFLKTDIDLFIGGGKKYFDRREDGRDLLAELKAKGYQVNHYFEKPLDKLNVNYQSNFAYLTSDSDPLTVEQGRSYLKPASIMACDFLDKRAKDGGFFLMIEGSQIDWGGHANNSQYIITEMIDFDNAIGAVLDFAAKDGNTLVIVTADHETGGYAINPGSTHDTIIGAFTSDYHTAALIPVFAFGPGSQLFNGIYENTEIYHKMRDAFGFGDKTAAE